MIDYMALILVETRGHACDPETCKKKTPEACTNCKNKGG
jgi:hypothetical protein